MHDPDRALPSPQQAFKMHEAGHIRAGDVLCAMTDMIIDAIIAHPYRYSFFEDGKSTAKSATFIFPVECNKFQSIHHP